MKKHLAVLTMLVMVMATISIASATTTTFPAKFPPKQGSDLTLIDSGSLIAYNYYDPSFTPSISDKKSKYWTYIQPNGNLEIYEKYYARNPKDIKWELKEYRVISITKQTSNKVNIHWDIFDANKVYMGFCASNSWSKSPLKTYNKYKRPILLKNHPLLATPILYYT